MLKHVLSITLCLMLVSPASLAEDKPAYPVVDGKYVVVERCWLRLVTSNGSRITGETRCCLCLPR